MTSAQARSLAQLVRRFTGEDTMRLTVEQNLSLRWLPEAEIANLHRELAALGLAEHGAGEVRDIVACPGTDTCKLGISSSRGLAAALEKRLAARDLPEDVRKLHIKASGCFNSCAQHHVADIGFLGVSRNVGGRRVAHFQLVVGGEWARNGGSYGLAVGAFPSKRVPEVVERVADFWLRERQPGERLQAFIQRVGRARLKTLLDDLREVPSYEADPSFYRDWGDAREYTIGDMGVGECAGEVVDSAQFGLAASEREVFEAQLALEAGDVRRAAELAYRAMLSAAKALVVTENIDIGDDPEHIVSEFRTRFCDTTLFYDRFAGAKFAMYLFHTHEDKRPATDVGSAHHRIEEAQLFIEAAHGCYDRIQERRAGGPSAAVAR
jgi:sulfite reductase (ferredoxin)